MKSIDMKTLNSPSSRNGRNSLGAARATIEREFSALREQQPRLFQLALNEAEAIAWQTGFPHLIFPTLASEKAREVVAWHSRQNRLRRFEPALPCAA